MPGRNQPRQKANRKLDNTTVVANLANTQQQFNRAGTDFLKVDVATALTFADAALSADTPEKKRRNQRSARKAYDTVLRMAQKVTLPNKDAEELRESLSQLRSNLQRLGEVF